MFDLALDTTVQWTKNPSKSLNLNLKKQDFEPEHVTFQQAISLKAIF